VGRSVATDLGERNPEGALAPVAYTDLLNEVFFAPITRPPPATDGGRRTTNVFTIFIQLYFDKTNKRRFKI
jgi:hypothetical protein